MDTFVQAGLEAGSMAADSLDQQGVRAGPPKLLVMMNRAEDGLGWKCEHEVAGGATADFRFDARERVHNCRRCR